MSDDVTVESLAADVALIRDNHLVHLQEDVSEIKAQQTEMAKKMIVMETKMDLAEEYLGKILKLLLPIALGAGIIAEAIGSNMM